MSFAPQFRNVPDILECLNHSEGSLFDFRGRRVGAIQKGVPWFLIPGSNAPLVPKKEKSHGTQRIFSRVPCELKSSLLGFCLGSLARTTCVGDFFQRRSTESVHANG
jgi:hypothetical protein